MYFHLHHIFFLFFYVWVSFSLSLSLSLAVSCFVNVCSVHQSGGSSKATGTRTAFLLHPSLTASSSTLLIFFPSLSLFLSFSTVTFLAIGILISMSMPYEYTLGVGQVHVFSFSQAPLPLVPWSLGFFLASPLTVLSSESTCYACLSSASRNSLLLLPMVQCMLMPTVTLLVHFAYFFFMSFFSPSFNCHICHTYTHTHTHTLSLSLSLSTLSLFATLATLDSLTQCKLHLHLWLLCWTL